MIFSELNGDVLKVKLQVSVLREKVIAAHPPYANMSCRLILAGTVLKVSI